MKKNPIIKSLFLSVLAYPALMNINYEAQASLPTHQAQAQEKKTEGSERTVIFVYNQNTKSLSLLIKPEIIDDWSRDEDKRIHDNRSAGWIVAEIPANSVVEIDFPNSQLGDPKLFSVSGETSPLTPLGNCYNMRVGRTYSLRFSDDQVGTSCLSVETSRSAVPVKGESIKVPLKVVSPHIYQKPPERPSQENTW